MAVAGCTDDPIVVSDGHIELSGAAGGPMTQSVRLAVDFANPGYYGLYLAFSPQWLRMTEGPRSSEHAEYTVFAVTEGMAAGVYEGQANFWTGPSAASPEETELVEITLTLSP